MSRGCSSLPVHDRGLIAMATARKVLLVGWDAADWKMIHPLMDHGLMPATRRLVEGGVMANLATLSPVLSPMLWTSIATGKRPYKHGILGFTEPTPDGTAVQPISSLSRKTKAVWNILSQAGKRSIVVGWWPSHPAEPINGVMVSNHYQSAPRRPGASWPMAKGTVHPPRLAQELAELRFHPLELEEAHIRPFIPHAEKIDQERDRRLDTCMRVIADCTSIQACATHLIEREPWDFAAIYFDAIDHFGHAFMKYSPPRQFFVSEEDFDIYQNVVAAGYVYHDLMLARLLELAGDDTTVMLVSDHGFHPDHLRPDGMPAEPAGPAIEHRDLGVFAMSGPGIRRDQMITGATLLDVTPTILSLFGLPVGEDVDGRPLVEAFAAPPEIRTIASWDEVPGEDGAHPPDERLDAEESRETLEQLVALGYIERPDEDNEKAVAKTAREQQYNLAMAYMDAGMHPRAAEILADLYHTEPLEFRFGIRLAICLQVMQMTAEMGRVVDHLNKTWRKAAEAARARLKEIAALARERRQALRADGEQAPDAEAAPPPAGQMIFNDAERHVIRQLRGIARGNERTLDYLSSSIAIVNRDYEAALGHLEHARESASRTPGFHLQVGNAYLELKRYDRAVDSYRRVLELDRENPNAHIGLARVALLRRRNRQALEHAQTAVGLKYHNPTGHFFFAIAQHRMGQGREAIGSLTTALAQNPNFPEAEDRLAWIYQQTFRNPKQAHEHRQQARQIRKMRREQSSAGRSITLPPLEAIDLDACLPSLPEPATERLRPPLGMAPLRRPGAEPDDRPEIIVVSGLPRSGTSMMMQMLAAGGLPLLADDERRADDSNPRGYFEYAKTRRLHSENDWLDEAQGRVIKVVAPLIPSLPQDARYRVILMEREIDEIIGSQRAMLARLGREGGKLDVTQLRRVLGRQLEQACQVLKAHSIPTLRVDYGDALERPAATAKDLAAFLGLNLDQQAMRHAIEPALRRERGAGITDERMDDPTTKSTDANRTPAWVA
jgi:predicted AlkP superfamily phosphohydrolase/phosphomutase/tetratricopeptide (TPR) repeat protein